MKLILLFMCGFYFGSGVILITIACDFLVAFMYKKYMDYLLDPKNLTDEENSFYFNREYARKK